MLDGIITTRINDAVVSRNKNPELDLALALADGNRKCEWDTFALPMSGEFDCNTPNPFYLRPIIFKNFVFFNRSYIFVM